MAPTLLRFELSAKLHKTEENMAHYGTYFLNPSLLMKHGISVVLLPKSTFCVFLDNVVVLILVPVWLSTVF